MEARPFPSCIRSSRSFSNVEKLTEELERLWKSLPSDGEVTTRLETLVSVYPFNEFEYMISALLGADLLSFDEYLRLRDEYIARNMYLHLFEISAPRGFGELWAQGHLKELVLPCVSVDRCLA